MGSLVITHAHVYDFCVTHAVVSQESKHLGQVVQESIGKKLVFENFVSVVPTASLVIEFSLPEATEETVAFCVKHKIPLVVATTGHSPEVRRRIEQAGKVIPLLIAANTSRAVFALTELSLLAAKLLGPRYDIEISEIHHKHKRDAPSGTALHVANAIAQDCSLHIVAPRHGPVALRQENEIGITAIRGGDVPGEHTVYFFGDSERVEITQRARDRAVFAHGALALGQILIKKNPGLYTVAELYRSVAHVAGHS
jgi:4-hydroxy-tetrahydrodipicolinate reductase